MFFAESETWSGSGDGGGEVPRRTGSFKRRANRETRNTSMPYLPMERLQESMRKFTRTTGALFRAKLSNLGILRQDETKRPCKHDPMLIITAVSRQVADNVNFTRKAFQVSNSNIFIQFHNNLTKTP